MDTEGFPNRLKQACDDSAAVPEMGRGRYVAIAKFMGVSEEAVRKWFSGDSRPRVKAMTRLAKYLGVDEGWLSLGIMPEVSPREKRVWAAQASGAVYILFGMIRAFGGTSAFPADNDPDRVNLKAIIGAVSVDLYVAAAKKTEDNEYVAYIPRGYKDSKVVVFVPGKKMKFSFLTIDSESLGKLITRKSGQFEVVLTHVSGQRYKSNENTVWKPLTSLEDLL